MSEVTKNGVILFVKYPDKGKVKSRLSAAIDKETVIKIYRFFVEDTLGKLKKSSYRKIICYYPSNSFDKFKKWLNSDYFYLPQKGSDLGERLKNGFHQCFKIGFSKLIAIGSDSPDLKLEYINDAFENLDYYDVVIGPCVDGGYYLIGFSKNSYFPEVFNDIPWSTEDVFDKSINVLKKANLQVCVLPFWQDVDTFDDLFYLYKKNLNSEFKNSKTMTFLFNFFKDKQNTNLGVEKIERK